MTDENRARAERTKEKLGEPGFFDLVCGNVANGGSVIELCRVMDLRYSDVILWLYRDQERKAVYEAAIAAQGQWMIERLLSELKQISTVDIRQAYTDEGLLKPIKDIPAEVAACIAAIETKELWEKNEEGDMTRAGDLVKVKFHDKLRSIELLGKKLAMFVERHEHEHKGKVTLEDLVAGSMEKPAAPPAPAQEEKEPPL